MKGKGLIVIAVLVILGLVGYTYIDKIFGANVSTPDGKEYVFFIPPSQHDFKRAGIDYREVGQQLLEAKLIRDPEAFHWVAEQMNYPRHVYPGRYILKDGMSTRELITLLRSGQQTPMNFTFVKFRTQQQLADYVGKELAMTPEQMMDVFRDTEFLKKHNGLTTETAMTIFIPNTYELYWNISPRAFFEKMFDQYKSFWNDSRNAKRRKLKLNRLEVMTLASIVEEETNQNDEKARVAGVYLNRIRKGMPLQADPTVKFAVGDFSLRRILNKHLQTDSPYNTYLYPGLPPAPICTPAIPSIEAVLNGEKHNYLYFCARLEGDGYHKFSETLSEHERYADQYRAMLTKRGIK
ncbi:MAG: endolytic transglycosylase MltG [Bacteroidota bacterium]